MNAVVFLTLFKHWSSKKLVCGCPRTAESFQHMYFHTLVCMCRASGKKEGKLMFFFFPARHCRWYCARREKTNAISSYRTAVYHSNNNEKALSIPQSQPPSGEQQVSFIAFRTWSFTVVVVSSTENKVVPPPPWRARHPPHLSGTGGDRYVSSWLVFLIAKSWTCICTWLVCMIVTNKAHSSGTNKQLFSVKCWILSQTVGFLYICIYINVLLFFHLWHAFVLFGWSFF